MNTKIFKTLLALILINLLVNWSTAYSQEKEEAVALQRCNRVTFDATAS